MPSILPDFPKIKNDLEKIVNIRVRDKVRHGDTVVGMIGSFIQHEGETASFETVEGQKRELNYEQRSASFSITNEEIKTITLEQIFERVDKVAAEISGHMAQTLFATIDQATKEAGTNMDLEGKPLTKEVFLEALSKIQIDFDPETLKPKMPSMVLSPAMFEKMKPRLEEWDKDEDMKLKHAEIMKKKLEDWYAREGNRKLVD